MRTVVIGAGAHGSILAARMHASGTQVTLVAPEPLATHIERHGLRLRGLAELQAMVPVVRELSQAPAADLYINATRTFEGSEVLQGVRPRPGAIAISLQNGIDKNRVLAEVFGAGRVLGAASFGSATALSDGTVRMTDASSLYVGEPGGGDSARCRDVAALLSGCGIAARTHQDIIAVEWAKCSLFVPMFCVALMTRLETSAFLRRPDTAQLVVMLMREMVALAGAEGVAVATVGVGAIAPATLAAVPVPEAVRQVREHGARLEQRAHRHKVSGLQDLERGRPTEVNETVGEALRRADARGLDLLHLRACHAVCSAVSPPALRVIPSPQLAEAHS